MIGVKNGEIVDSVIDGWPMVFVASPLAAPKFVDDHPDLLVEENLRYAEACCRDAYERNEIPFAPHLFYPRFLTDEVPKERQAGMDAGLWMMERACHKLLLYVDLGMSSGMEVERAWAAVCGVPCAVRALGRSRTLMAGVSYDQREPGRTQAPRVDVRHEEAPPRALS